MNRYRKNKAISNNKKYRKISLRNENLMSEKQRNHFKDITVGFMKIANPDINLGIEDAKSITKDGKKYLVNSKNKIIWKNNERKNGEWFLNIMGGKLKRLPEINSTEGVKMADFKYFPIKSKPFFLENKEIILKSSQSKAGINNIFHKIEESINQSEVFIIDVTDGKLTDIEILERLDLVFRHPKIKNFRKILLIKNKNKLFGIFTDK